MKNIHDWQPTGNTTLSHRRPMKVDRFWFGAPYYPEHWDAETREQDAERMAAAGFNMVRMAEFAWDRLEPSEGTFDFSLFDETVQKLGAKGIYTMMCTPTATPPRWFTVKYPETLRVNTNGVIMQHGSRQHCCHSNSIFRDYSRKITRAMAEHYRGNKFVTAWQTDNEFNCHFAECHCPSCEREFQDFCRLKFNNDIDALNQAWGNAFWALTYTDFDQITLPKDGAPAFPNPAHQLDYYRYLSYIIENFQHDQIAILRASNPDWFIIHNGLHQKTDFHGPFTQDLDALGYDIYPLFTPDKENCYLWHAQKTDLARAYSGNFFVPEHQSGPGGQKPYFHDNPEPGEIRKMSYVTISRGCDSLLYFRWRTCRFGAEEYWCGILDHDNVPRRRYQEIAQIGQEMKTVGEEILGTHVHIDCAVAAGDYDVTEADNTLSFGLKNNKDVAGDVHAVLFKGGLSVGFVHPEDDLRGIKLYLIPHWAVFDSAWVPKLENYVADGGLLVIGGRTATRDTDNNVVAETIPGCLRKLAGITVEKYGRQNRPDQKPKFINLNGKSQITEQWYEVLNLENAAEFATWSGRHLGGKTAISINAFGKGKVLYVGTYLTTEIMEMLLPELLKLAGLEKTWADSPAGVSVVLRKNADKKIWFLINNNDEEIILPSTPQGTSLITGRQIDGSSLTLPLYGVEVIKE